MNAECYSLLHSVERVFQYIGITIVSFVIIIMLCCCTCWIYRQFYSNLPSLNLEPIYIYLNFVAYDSNIPFSTFVFNECIKLCKRFEKYGLVLIWGIYPLLAVFGEKYVKILANERAAINKAPFAYEVLEDMLGKGLLTKNGETWWHQRKMLVPAFRMKLLNSHVSVFNERAKDIVKELTKVCNRPSTELLHILKIGTLQIVCEAVLGIKLDNKKDKESIEKYISLLARLSEYTVYRIPRPWLWSKWTQLLFSKGREHWKDFKEFQSFSAKMMKEIKASMPAYVHKDSDSLTEKSYHSAKSFVHILLENHLKDPSFTMKDVQTEVNLIIFGGHDTLSYTMLWCLFMLGLHSEIQEKAFEEVTRVAGTKSNYSYADLNELVYLESVIKETMRIFPTVPVFARKLTRDMKCGEYDIPKNTIIGFLPYLIHRIPSIYPDPEKFDPDRFSQHTLKHPWAYIPFSEGMRSCIGKKFAMMEMKIILAHILRNFRITSLDKREDIALSWNLLLTPSRPIRFHFTSRQPMSSPKG